MCVASQRCDVCSDQSLVDDKKCHISIHHCIVLQVPYKPSWF